MRLLSTYGSRADVEPIQGLAVQLRALDEEVPACAPPDFAELMAGVGVPRVPATVAAAATGCDALVATGAMPTGVQR